MTVQDGKKSNGSGAHDDIRPASLGRRAILKRGVVAMPAILTLQSGAALARSSNLISASHPRTTDRRGRTLCIDSRSVYPAGGRRGARVYDLGNPPHAVVNVIRDGDISVENPDDHADYSGDWDSSRDWESKDKDWHNYQTWDSHDGGQDYSGL